MGIKDQDLGMVVPFLAGVASDVFAGVVSSFRLLSSVSSAVELLSGKP
jgi:hypothetical protein